MNFIKLLLVSLVSFFTIAAFASDGNLVGNAGDVYVGEFKAIAKDIVSDFKNRRLKSKHFNPIDLEKMVNETFVSSEENLFLWNSENETYVEVDAINFYPTHKWIKINRSRWRIMASERLKYMLVLHEYLVLMGLPDLSYDLSSSFYFDRPARVQFFIPFF
ncbi:MAG: hypothetical protein JNL11_15380 [Bdellovibrionaceae bacterium]|nr:hypothetical protein [Pseudobdellovibrionaceae bacterium]